MKKVLLLVVFLIATSVGAQNKIAQEIGKMQKLNADFKPVSVLSPIQNTANNEVNKAVDEATLATLDITKVNEIVTNQYGTIELTIPYQGQQISILLYKVNPFAEGFHVDTDKGKNFPYQTGVHYRGIINGDTNSVSSFNFFNGEFNGIFSNPEFGNVVVGKLDKANNQTDYIVYSDAKMKITNDWDCHVKEDGFESTEASTTARDGNTVKCVTFYFEVDYTLYVQNGSNITTTTNWMTSVYNNVQTLFNNDGITTALKSIFVWTTIDPYSSMPSGSTSGDYLGTFAQNRPVFNGDVGMLVGIDPGGLGGVAYLNSVCGQSNYAYSDVNFSFATVPTYSWTVQVITHEFGHSLGSPHTHGCYWNGNNTAIDGCGQQAGYSEGNCAQGPIPTSTVKGTIMSYCHLVSGVGISFANGFGPQPATLITNTVNGKSCLSSDCINTCINTVAEVFVNNVSETSAVITWNDLNTSQTSWQISVTLIGAPSSWQTVNTNSYTVSNLAPNTYYDFRIRPICTGITPVFERTIFATAGNYCGGMLFTDSGGQFNEHSNMESFTRTMIPNQPNQMLRAVFSAFELELDYDYLYIYDGPSEAYPEFFPGGYTGTNSPGTITSSAPDGSLTFKFFSDQYITAPGWVANISCLQSLSTGENNYIDYSYYPNPTTGNITINSKDPISEVTVYNVQGQLLFSQKMNEMTTNIDMSSFAGGTYFFKLKINGVEANFKVLKM
ncbi:T9SS type A sorting domain-containing protein [Flavobacterium sp. J49]|uniref:M12 family metallo-peptidase n=1 Tax=Flavobacterium sp. J49 TaxID=2718534 RepID=UPI0015945B36|nr:M12 family metallo-peptidase [Flavobacterium sp. J49]MBF6641575.1 T9SS type A sorting domain-containing protein [Flavobacterium sp. J49]NIC02822.1 T9SS type A sorting domain-containing protein [Flavobacterium sp. J49]